MRALLAVIALAAASAQAAPFLVADVPDQAEIDACTVAGLPAAIAPRVSVTAGAPRTCRWDMAALPAGSYTVTARATSSLWGLISEPSGPFGFVRPATAGVIGTPRLVP
jgi:glucose/arabinose dehydrogenase